MRRVFVLVAACVFGLASMAWAGDYHVNGNLICSDCHVAHYSQQHALTSGGTYVPLGTAGPYEDLLRNDPNHLCLSCHDNNSIAPDVLGDNAGKYPTVNRLAGALNVAGGHGLTNDVGYDGIDGHTLYSADQAPGGTFQHATEGLECVDCHMQHGHVPTQYRNLWTSTTSGNKFNSKTLTYQPGGSNDPTKDVFERNIRSYDVADVDYNEPDQTKSAYGSWCSSCHTTFHGAGGSTDMGGKSGGTASNFNANPWLRHPTADVNIGNNPFATYISSLPQFNTGGLAPGTKTNYVKVMSNSGNWTDHSGTTTDFTPSCFSCHKSHGNKNGFGLIFMAGTGPMTGQNGEQGDGGQYRDLCRQCHVQGS